MFSLFLTLVITLAYMETVYHFSIAGMRGMNPLLLIPLVLVLAGMEFLLVSIGKRAVNRGILWLVQLINFFLFASQLVYIRVFTQPLLIAAIKNAGENAVKNYWREIFYSIGKNMGYLLLLAVPLFITGFLLHRKKDFYLLQEKETVRKIHVRSRIAGAASMVTGIAAIWVSLLIGYQAGYTYYQDYQDFYDPAYVVKTFGVLASVQRDCMGDVLPEAELQTSAAVALNPMPLIKKLMIQSDRYQKESAPESRLTEMPG